MSESWEIVLGPPGTGKTRTLLECAEQELARGTSPDRIGYVSFTRRAAGEAVSRAREKFGLTKEDMPHFSTLHSLCYRALGLRRGDVLSGRRMEEFSEYVGVPVTRRAWTEDGDLQGFELGDRILFMDNLARVRRAPLRSLHSLDDDGLDWPEVDRVSRSLSAFKSAEGLLDYTDMLEEFVRTGLHLKLEALFVDEAQDLSRLQWEVVERLAQGCRRVVVAGDDDQAIYRWAGADVDYLIDLRGRSRVLQQSWRVPPVAQVVAERVIRNVARRREKTWSARAGVRGSVRYVPNFEDGELIAALRKVEGKAMVLVRNSYLLREQVEPVLRDAGVLYEKNTQDGAEASVSSETRERVTTWERLRRGQRVSAHAAARVYDGMTADRGYRRGERKKLRDAPDDATVTMDELRQKHGLLRTDPWFDALDRVRTEEREYVRRLLAGGAHLTDEPRVTVSTIHGSKGGEADHVVLFREMARRTWNGMMDDPDDEARVFYVAVTRTRDRLTIVQSQTLQECPWF